MMKKRAYLVGIKDFDFIDQGNTKEWPKRGRY